MATLKGVLKAGKKFAGEAAGKAKSNAVRGVGNAVFGSGIVGGALNKAFQGKFGEKEGSDTQVADALEAQTKVQDQNSAVLTRIESIVMNIADNVYNLAGVMNAQVVSMQEAQKIQQDRAYKQAADQEEAAAEAKKVQGPSAAGTEVNPVEDKKGGIMGMISGLAGSIGSTKKLFKGFLKKFGVLALGITTAIGAAAYVSPLGDGEKKNEDPSGTISVKGDAEQQSAPFVSGTVTSTDAQTPQQSQGASISSSSPEGEMMSSFTGMMGQSSDPKVQQMAPVMGGMFNSAMSGDVGGMFSGFSQLPPADAPTAPAANGGAPATAPTPAATPAPAPAATPAAPPPAPAATVIPLTAGNQKLKEWFDLPENAGDKATLDEFNDKLQTAKTGIKDAEYGIKTAVTPEQKTKWQDLLDFYKSAEKQILQQKIALLNKARIATGQPVKAAGAAPGATPSAAPEAASGGGAAGSAMGGGAGGGVGAGGGGGGSGGGSGGASPVSAPPSTGADIGSTSTAVAAASEPSTPKNNVSEFSTSKDEGMPPPSAIPSPIANRGSLDIGTVFGSES